jgi:hypothetical protein
MGIPRNLFHAQVVKWPCGAIGTKFAKQTKAELFSADRSLGGRLCCSTDPFYPY